jgi:very-short-patch-repair endonuclease
VTPTYRDDFRSSTLKEVTRRLRRVATPEERLLWSRLREWSGAKFRRQHQFGPYVLDFYAPDAHLAVEVDGGQHFDAAGQASDAERTAYLESRGLRVLRFTNLEVRRQVESVLMAIEVALGAAPSPCPSPRGRGDADVSPRDSRDVDADVSPRDSRDVDADAASRGGRDVDADAASRGGRDVDADAASRGGRDADADAASPGAAS